MIVVLCYIATSHSLGVALHSGSGSCVVGVEFSVCNGLAELNFSLSLDESVANYFSGFAVYFGSGCCFVDVRLQGMSHGVVIIVIIFVVSNDCGVRLRSS